MRHFLLKRPHSSPKSSQILENQRTSSLQWSLMVSPGHRLDSMTLEGFSNLNNSMFCQKEPWELEFLGSFVVPWEMGISIKTHEFQ